MWLESVRPRPSPCPRLGRHEQLEHALQHRADRRPLLLMAMRQRAVCPSQARGSGSTSLDATASSALARCCKTIAQPRLIGHDARSRVNVVETTPPFAGAARILRIGNGVFDGNRVKRAARLVRGRAADCSASSRRTSSPIG